MKYIFYLITFLDILSIVKLEKKRIIYLINEADIESDISISHCIAAGDFLANENISSIFYSPKAKKSAFIVGKRFSGPPEFVEVFNIFSEGQTDDITKKKIKEEILYFIWEDDYEVYAIISDEMNINILSSIFLKDSSETLLNEEISHCSISKIIMEGRDTFIVEYWNDSHFFKEGEEKYLKE